MILNGGTSITLNTLFFGFVTGNSYKFYACTNSKKSFETVNFFQKEAKTAPKRPMLLFRISRRFRPFYDNSGFFQKISEGYWRFLKTVEDFRRLTKRSDYCQRCSKMTLLFSSETANTKKLANLRANNTNYWTPFRPSYSDLVYRSISQAVRYQKSIRYDQAATINTDSTPKLLLSSVSSSSSTSARSATLLTLCLDILVKFREEERAFCEAPWHDHAVLIHTLIICFAQPIICLDHVNLITCNTWTNHES